MVLLIIGQVSLIGEHTYTGASSVYLYTDANGDGVSDALVYYGDTLVKVYDSISDNVLASFSPPSGYSTYSLYVLGNGRFLYSVYNYSSTPRVFKFFLYDNFNNLLFESPDLSYDYYGYAYPFDFNRDGYLEIIVYTDVTVRIYGTPFTKTLESSTPVSSEFRVDAAASSGRFQIPAVLHSPAKLTITNGAGRVILRRNLQPAEKDIPLNIPSGIYLYRIESSNITISGKLIIE